MNIIKCGDNLTLLKELPDQSVDLCYLDPPYNTNNKFNDFDDTWDNKERYILEDKDLSQIIDITEKAHSKGAANYLSFLAIRLLEIHRIIKDTGVLWLQCDDNMNSYIQLILDTIFGRKNFKNHVIWRRSYGARKIKNRLMRNTDSIFFYTKTNKYYLNTDKHRNECSKEYLQSFKYVDKKGRYMLRTLTSNRERGYEYKLFGIKKKWSISEKKAKEMIENNTLIQKKHGQIPMRKTYEENIVGSNLPSLWTDISLVSNQFMSQTIYSTEKPVKLIQRIIEISSKQNDLILDPFCGSGTTALACINLNRKYILFDQNPKAIEITKTRIEKYKKDTPLFF